MDDVASVRNENANLRIIRTKLLQWELKDYPLAALTPEQQKILDELSDVLDDDESEVIQVAGSSSSCFLQTESISKSLTKLQESNQLVDTTHDFLAWYDQVDSEIHHYAYDVYRTYLQQLQIRHFECEKILQQIDFALKKLENLKTEYKLVASKTSSLNTASEKLIQEQAKLNDISEEIQRRLHFFNQAEQLAQRLQSSTLSVTSDNFMECIVKIDECLDYLRQNPKFKESSAYIVKYKHCLARAIYLLKAYVTKVMFQATEQLLAPRKSSSAGLPDSSTVDNALPEAAFALYYGKFQSSAAKVKRISLLIEERVGRTQEYDQLLTELHSCYLTHRANIMSPAVDKAIKDLKEKNRGDHCTLMRSACAFLVHVCQDEHRLFYQFFTLSSDQLNSYLEGLSTILYDALRPNIIHINHLETLAEICSIIRIEMLDEHVQQNPESLGAFGRTAFQLLQDVQERLVFRAHLYLQSDILNYKPSAGDLAYPDKLEMMESIALSLQEPPQLRRSDSRSSIISTASSAIPDNESIDSHYRPTRSINSPADLHGMWYPTVRRTLVCLSRLYRCVDRPIFQGLSQEILQYCMQSISSAATQIATKKSSIDGELFEIKHLLILREQIAPFRVDFTVTETSLDFSKVKTAAYGLLQKRKQLFSLGTNNALLEFLLDGTPQVKEHLLDSRKDVDRQLKMVCEKFIRDSVQLLVGLILGFIEKAQAVLAEKSTKDSKAAIGKVNYSLRQSQWASPQHISGLIQESQRLIKSKLSGLQRSMQLYLSNKDTEFIIFRPIRNNIISSFVKLEQILLTNGYTSDDLIIASCPSAEQISILLSSASILSENSRVSGANMNQLRKISVSLNEGTVNSSTGAIRKHSVLEKKVSFDGSLTLPEKIQDSNHESDNS